MGYEETRVAGAGDVIGLKETTEGRDVGRGVPVHEAATVRMS